MPPTPMQRRQHAARCPRKARRKAAQHQADVQDGEQHELAEAVEGLLMGAQILVGEPRILDDVGHDDFLYGFAAERRTPAPVALAARPGNIDRMKLIVSALAALPPRVVSSRRPNPRSRHEEGRRRLRAQDMATAVADLEGVGGQGQCRSAHAAGRHVLERRGRAARSQGSGRDSIMLAANQGYARAQNDIGFMLGFGEGIPPQDDVEAYKWLTLAIKGYTAKNQDRLDQARKDLATLAKRMSPAQIREAERRAKAFKPTP